MRGQTVIAGCGYLGVALAAHLARRPGADGTVWGLRRRPGALPPGVRPLAADLTAPGLAARLPTGPLDAVVLMAAADASTPAAYAHSYVAAARNLVTALRGRDGPRPRLLFTSSTAMYEQDDGRWVDEATPTEPAGFRGRLLLAAEAHVHGFGGHVLRLTGIYGPGRASLVAAVRAGTLRLPAAPRPVNRIHLEDCVGALAHLLALPLPPSVLIATDDLPASRAAVARLVAARLAGRHDGAAEVEPDPTAGRRCSNGRLKATGYQLQVPSYVAGYGALAADFTC